MIELAYIGLGLVGMLGHWAKKRYIDKTTTCTLKEYIVGEPKSTLNAVGTMVVSEIGLAAAAVYAPFTVTAIVGALSAGYVVDSWLDKAPKEETKWKL